jgi:hypothetical protein
MGPSLGRDLGIAFRWLNTRDKLGSYTIKVSYFSVLSPDPCSPKAGDEGGGAPEDGSPFTVATTWAIPNEEIEARYAVRN